MRFDDITYITMQAVYKPENIDYVGDIISSKIKTKPTPKLGA